MNKKIEELIKIQKEAEEAHVATNGRKSTVAMSVGLGKSKLAINRIVDHFSSKKNSKIIFAGARELYLDGFKTELIKFGHEDYIDKIHFCCTGSLKNYEEIPDLVIYDESHIDSKRAFDAISNWTLFHNKTEVLCLTGTPGTPLNNILLTICPISYSKDTEESVKANLLNDYEITLVYHDLSTDNKSYKSKRYTTSEQKQYNWLSKKYKESQDKPTLNKSGFSFELSMLKNFFTNLKSKEEIAKQILTKFDPNYKTLVYCGSIAETKKFPYPSYHSKIFKEKRKKNLQDFIKGLFPILTNVNGIRESSNVPGLKYGLKTSVSASTSAFEQIKGRFHRMTIGETSKLYILVARNTIEEKWIETAIKNVDPAKIKRISL